MREGDILSFPLLDEDAFMEGPSTAMVEYAVSAVSSSHSVVPDMSPLNAVVERFPTAAQLKVSGLIRDRTWNLREYKQCFTGKEVVAFMLKAGLATTEQHALELGQVSECVSVCVRARARVCL